MDVPRNFSDVCITHDIDMVLFPARNSLTSEARSDGSEWWDPSRTPCLHLSSTTFSSTDPSFGRGWRFTASLTRCLMSTHLSAFRQVDLHLHPPRCLATSACIASSRRCEYDEGLRWRHEVETIETTNVCDFWYVETISSLAENSRISWKVFKMNRFV